MIENRVLNTFIAMSLLYINGLSYQHKLRKRGR